MEQFGEVAGAGHELHLFNIVTDAFIIATAVFAYQLEYLLFVVFTRELPYYFFCYVPADIFVVVASATHLLFLL